MRRPGMKRIGQILLGVSFLTGAFFTVQDSDEVRWNYFVPCIVLMLIATVLLQLAKREESSQESAGAEGMDILHSSLDITLQRLRGLVEGISDMDVYEVHDRIDAELADPLNDFASAREAMIPKIGMTGYADVMGSFATGERLINRSWCASADGYIDEVRTCLDDAEREMHRAQVQLRELSA